jgi:hypothetical protein
VRDVGGWLLDFWGLWCRIAAEAGCIGCVVVMVFMMEDIVIS